jgi:hypothetical protein
VTPEGFDGVSVFGRAVRAHHQNRVMRAHRWSWHDTAMQSHELKLYSIRVRGHLGAASLAAFPQMVSQRRGCDSILTGVLQDQPALFGVLAEIENLALELLELRRIVPRIT